MYAEARDTTSFKPQKQTDNRGNDRGNDPKDVGAFEKGDCKKGLRARRAATATKEAREPARIRKQLRNAGTAAIPDTCRPT
eukprot:7758217-Heterocapsa_arctica.AAC.1